MESSTYKKLKEAAGKTMFPEIAKMLVQSTEVPKGQIELIRSIAEESILDTGFSPIKTDLHKAMDFLDKYDEECQKAVVALVGSSNSKSEDFRWHWDGLFTHLAWSIYSYVAQSLLDTMKIDY